jgi:hypothetical protein
MNALKVIEASLRFDGVFTVKELAELSGVAESYVYVVVSRNADLFAAGGTKKTGKRGASEKQFRVNRARAEKHVASATQPSTVRKLHVVYQDLLWEYRDANSKTQKLMIDGARKLVRQLGDDSVHRRVIENLVDLALLERKANPLSDDTALKLYEQLRADADHLAQRREAELAAAINTRLNNSPLHTMLVARARSQPRYIPWPTDDDPSYENNTIAQLFN